MEVLITHRGRLVEKYGAAGWDRIANAVDDYLDALNSVGLNAGLELLDHIVPVCPAYDKRQLASIKSALRKTRG